MELGRFSRRATTLRSAGGSSMLNCSADDGEALGQSSRGEGEWDWATSEFAQIPSVLCESPTLKTCGGPSLNSRSSCGEMIAVLTIQKYACRNFSSSRSASAGAASALAIGPWEKSATSKCRATGFAPGLMGACERRRKSEKVALRSRR